MFFETCSFLTPSPHSGSGSLVGGVCNVYCVLKKIRGLGWNISDASYSFKILSTKCVWLISSTITLLVHIRRHTKDQSINWVTEVCSLLAEIHERDKTDPFVRFPRSAQQVEQDGRSECAGPRPSPSAPTTPEHKGADSLLGQDCSSRALGAVALTQPRRQFIRGRSNH